MPALRDSSMRKQACMVCGRPSFGPRCRKHQLAARARGNAFEPTRQFVLERDGWECQVKLDEGCTMAATCVDHVIPRAAGGSDHPDNLQASCEHCNAAKGASAPRPRGV